MNEKPDLICGSVIDCNSITQLKIKLIYIFGPIKSEWSLSHKVGKSHYAVCDIISLVSEVKEPERKKKI